MAQRAVLKRTALEREALDEKQVVWSVAEVFPAGSQAWADSGLQVGLVAKALGQKVVQIAGFTGGMGASSCRALASCWSR